MACSYIKPLLLVLTTHRALAALECYLPNGTIVADQRACPGVTESAPGPCCKSTEWPNIDPCLSNGMCLSTTDGYLYTGACTNGNWLGCNDKCVPDFYGADYAVVTPCYVPQNESLYCCGYIGDTRTRNCCSNRTGHDFLEGGQPTWLGPLNATTLSNVTAVSDETSSSLGSADATVTVTGAPKGGHVKSAAAVGLGVGLGVPLLIALGSIAWLWVLLKRQRGVSATIMAHHNDFANKKSASLSTWQQDFQTQAVSYPAELKATAEISEVPSDSATQRVEAPTERM